MPGRTPSRTRAALLRAYAPPAAASHLAGVDRSEPIQVEGRCYVERSALARAAGTSTVGVAEFAGRRGVERPLGAARLIPLRFAICYVMLQGARPPVRWLEVEGESLTEIASDLFLQTELELEAAERESRSARVLFDANQVGRIVDFAVADRTAELELASPRRGETWSDEMLEAIVRSHNSGLTRTASER